MTLTKAEIVEEVLKSVELTQQEAKDFVDAFYEEISQSLQNGCDVKLSGFGNFTLRDKCARPGRNPKTGEEVVITPRRVVTFKAGQKMKTEIQQSLSKK
jgi:integration host factor subunit alpha